MPKGLAPRWIIVIGHNAPDLKAWCLKGRAIGASGDKILKISTFFKLREEKRHSPSQGFASEHHQRMELYSLNL